MPTIAEILKTRITKGGKSKTYIASELKVTEKTIENYMRGKREPDATTLVKLSKLLGFELNEISEQTVPDPPVVNEDQVEYSRLLPLGNLKMTVKDYVEDLRKDKEKLQNTIDANLTAMMQILTVLQRHDRVFHETILKSLSRIEGGNIDLVLEARKSEAEQQIQDSLQGNKAQVDR